VEFNNISTLSNELPDTGTSPTDFLQGEVYRGVASVHFIGVRMCKGDANSTDPSTIACSVGGFVANAVWEFGGNYQATKYNPGSNSSQFDIITAFAPQIDLGSLTAALVDANGLPTTDSIDPSTCFLRNNISALRCNYDVSQFGQTQCPSPFVNFQVRGQFSNGTLQKFKAQELNIPCSTGK
jgi:hypothetical protein